MILDEIDKGLLDLLQDNAHLGYAELGKHVGLSVSAINERIKKLEANGFIQQYAAHLNPKQVGFDICAFIQVLLSTPEYEDGFLANIMQLPEVQECHHITGEFSYMLKIRVRTTQSLELFLKRGLKTIPGIARTSTSIVLSSPKETTKISLSLD